MKDLSDFFNLVSVEKKRQKEEINSFLGEDFFYKNIVDYFMESSSLKKNSNNLLQLLLKIYILRINI